MLGCRVNQEDFITVNHEMGHIQYFLQYSDQSYFFRTGDYSHCHIAVKDGRMVFLSKVPTRASTRGWLTSFPLLLAPRSTSRYLIWVSLAPSSLCLKITTSFFPHCSRCFHIPVLSRKFSPKSSLKQNWLNAILRSFAAGTISISCSYLS